MHRRSGHVALKPVVVSRPARHGIGLLASLVGVMNLRGVGCQDSLSHYVEFRI
jgi:hypothetical protein